MQVKATAISGLQVGVAGADITGEQRLTHQAGAHPCPAVGIPAYCQQCDCYEKLETHHMRVPAHVQPFAYLLAVRGRGRWDQAKSSRQGTRGALCAPCSRNAGAAQKRFAPKEDRWVSAKLVAAIDDVEVWDEAEARARLTITQILRAAALHRAVNELRAPHLRLGDVSRRARV